MSNATEPDSSANAELRGFARRVLGDACRFEDRSRSFGRRSITWRIAAGDGSGFYLKRHEHRHHYEAELLSLREWSPLLDPCDGWRTPAVIDSDDTLGALVMSEVPGTFLHRDQWGRAERNEVYRLAGRLAAEIHRLPVDPFACGHPALYDAKQWQSWLSQAAPLLEEGLLEWVRTTCASPEPFAGLLVVPTHADYSPRNWLVERSGGGLRFGLIDWERARAGYWLEDLRTLAARDWAPEPELRSAFLEGYGRRPTPPEEEQLRLMIVMTATITIPWARAHGDEEFQAFALATLERLRAES